MSNSLQHIVGISYAPYGISEGEGYICTRLTRSDMSNSPTLGEISPIIGTQPLEK